MGKNNKLIVICGPTGTGKTELGIKLCQKFNGEIVSADSRQIYIGADVGTNKKPARSASGGRSDAGGSKVKIHLYDAVKPNEYYSASRFLEDAKVVIEKIWAKGKLPFVVGGTGFYLDALLGRVKLSGVPANPELRKELKGHSSKELQKILNSLNSEKLKSFDQAERQNPHRLTRAIEIELGKPKQPTAPTVPLKTKTLWIGLTAPRKFLYEKGDKWVKEIVKKGLIAETRKLLSKNYRQTALLQGLIYQPTVDYLDGRLNKKTLTTTIQYQLHAYIRRQITYFKRNPKIHWLDISKLDFDKEAEKLVEWW